MATVICFVLLFLFTVYLQIQVIDLQGNLTRLRNVLRESQDAGEEWKRGVAEDEESEGCQ